MLQAVEALVWLSWTIKFLKIYRFHPWTLSTALWFLTKTLSFLFLFLHAHIKKRLPLIIFNRFWDVIFFRDFCFHFFDLVRSSKSMDISKGIFRRCWIRHLSVRCLWNLDVVRKCQILHRVNWTTFMVCFTHAICHTFADTGPIALSFVFSYWKNLELWILYHSFWHSLSVFVIFLSILEWRRLWCLFDSCQTIIEFHLKQVGIWSAACFGFLLARSIRSVEDMAKLLVKLWRLFLFTVIFSI